VSLTLTRIPNTLHYCWFGHRPLPRTFRQYIAGWRRTTGGGDVKQWTVHDLPRHAYLARALESGKYANAANWARLWILKNHGGVYLDTDIEMVRPLDDLLAFPAFVGFEVKHFDWEGCVNNAVLGSEPEHWFVSEMLEDLQEKFDGTEEAHLSSPHLTTQVLQRHGLNGYGRACIKGVEVFPVEYFYPFGWHESFRVGCVRPETRTIHWYERSWQRHGDKRKRLDRWLKDKLHVIAWRLMRNQLVSRAKS
jgi:mannosyltransferase OCH1-like enzyme